MKKIAAQFELGLICAAVALLTACGGGGAGADVSAGASTVRLTTTVMDGLIENALVCADTNNNNLCEATETQGRTNKDGQVTLAMASAERATTHLIAIIGLDAVDADTGPVTTAYTLKTPAGKHDVISPLTHMVKTKIDTDRVSGITTSVDNAAAFVKAQTSLSVSVFDNFIAKRDSDDTYRKAGEVARMLVVSTQQSKEACKTSVSRDKSRDDDDHAYESGIDDDLVGHLEEIRTRTNSVAAAYTYKDSSSAIKDHDEDYKREARTSATCAVAP